MESERHEFMRKLLQLCVDTGGVCFDAYSAPHVYKADGEEWITDLHIELETKTASGYWDGERHEVWL